MSKSHKSKQYNLGILFGSAKIYIPEEMAKRIKSGCLWEGALEECKE